VAIFRELIPTPKPKAVTGQAEVHHHNSPSALLVSCSSCLSCRPFRLLFFIPSAHITFLTRPSSRSTYLTIQYYGYRSPWSLPEYLLLVSVSICYLNSSLPRFTLCASLFPIPYPATTTIRTTYQTRIKSPSNHTHGKPGIEPFLPLLLSTP
jgi:hypothetical protein